MDPAEDSGEWEADPRRDEFLQYATETSKCLGTPPPPPQQQPRTTKRHLHVILLSAVESGEYHGEARIEQTNGCMRVVYDKLLQQRVRTLRTQWMGCMCCGRKKLKHYSFVREQPEHEAIVCGVKCAKRHFIYERKGCHHGWTHQTRVSIANHLVLGAPLPIPRHPEHERLTIGSNLAQDVTTTYANLFVIIEELQKQIQAALDVLKKQQQHAGRGEQGDRCASILRPLFLQWMENFTRWADTVNTLAGEEFRGDLGRHLQELIELYERYVPKEVKEGKEVPAGALDVDTVKYLAQVKALLQELAKTVPFSKPMLDKKDLLEKLVLGPEGYPKGKRILTVDGGGVRGVIPATILKHVLFEIRTLTQNPKAQLTDYFDLVVATSTGAVLSAATFVLHRDPKEVIEMYRTISRVIFSEENKTRMPITNPAPGIAATYDDLNLTEFFMKESNNWRLDDPEVAYDGRHNRVRLAFTSLEMSTTDPRLTLFRNYPPPRGEESDNRVIGTNHAALWEALRCSTAAASIFHPYGRHYAPRYKPEPTAYSDYTREIARTGLTRGSYREELRLFTHHQMLIARAKDEAHKRRYQVSDKFMNSNKVFVDGGQIANNPALVGTIEAMDVWPNERVAVLLSLGTGRSPPVANPTWNGTIPEPLSLSYVRKPRIIEAVRDLLVNSLAFPASETEDTEYVVKRMSSVLASYTRLNPPLATHVKLDDAREGAIEKLIEETEAWVATTEATELIRSVARDIVNNSH